MAKRTSILLKAFVPIVGVLVMQDVLPMDYVVPVRFVQPLRLAPPAEAADKKAKLQQKQEYETLKFSFPDEPALGVLDTPTIADVSSDSLQKFSSNSAKLGSARGKVSIRVPKGLTVTFVVGPGLVNHPELLSKIDPTNIKNVRMRVTSFSPEEEARGDEFMRRIGALKNIEFLNISGADISDKGMSGLAALQKLRWVCLHNTLMTPRSLVPISSIKAIENLDISAINMSSADFSILSSMPNLTQLSLSDCQIADAQLKPLAGCKKLNTLILSGNSKITDKSLPYILAIKSLVKLELADTSVSLYIVPKLSGISYVGLDEKIFSGMRSKVIKQHYPNVSVYVKSKPFKPPSADELKLFAPTRY